LGISCGGRREVIAKESAGEARAIDFLLKFWRLSRQDRLLLLEAIVWLGIAALAVALLPFRHVGLLAARPIRTREVPSKERLDKARRIRWAIISTAARVPWRALCFQQGLAAQLMLRRRGIPSVLYYGAAQDDRSGLSAHVWVRDGDLDVIGGEMAYRFAILATFPPQNPEMVTRL
jgi:Transglutaminase-like superfamily